MVQQWQASVDHAAWWDQHSGVYHLTSQGYTSWQGFAAEIIRQAEARGMLGKPAPVVHGIPSSDYPTPAARPANSCLDNSRLVQTFGLELPQWQAALQNCLQAG
jgi:dTDP-4-dehydrorhamnose reductase